MNPKGIAALVSLVLFTSAAVLIAVLMVTHHHKLTNCRQTYVAGGRHGGYRTHCDVAP